MLIGPWGSMVPTSAAVEAQVITFSQPASPRAIGSSFAVAPIASSGLPLTTNAAGACSITATTPQIVTMTQATGACFLTATQTGNAGFTAATPVTRAVVAQSVGGAAITWGFNDSGQLGDTSSTLHATPVAVTNAGILSGKTVVALAAGYQHSLALTSDGIVVAWGNNDFGQLGNNSTTPSAVPVAVYTAGVLNGKTVVAIAASYQHSLALTSDGLVAAWGRGNNGRLGDNSTHSSSMPVWVTNGGVLSGKTVVAIAAGFFHSMALTSDGLVVTWGNNGSGQPEVPVAVTSTGLLSGKMVVAIAAGQWFSMALTSDGRVAAWGKNDAGQLGSTSTEVGSSSAEPVPVTTGGALNGKTVVAIAAGQNHSLALTSDGQVAAWGANFNGQLGNNSITPSAVPVAVTGDGVLSGRTVVAIVAGGKDNLALTSDGLAATWGYNGFGQLGNNSTTPSAVPVMVSSGDVRAGKTVVAITAGYAHRVAVQVSSLTQTFSQQPSRAAAGQAFGYQPVVTLKGPFGNVTSDDNTTAITLAIATNTGAPSSMLTCTPSTVTVVHGVAAFAGCSIDKPGPGYVLTASANGASPINSAPLNVTLAGDTDGDCRVTIIDFSVVVAHFGKTSLSPDWADGLAFRGDLNGDGRISIADFSLLVSRFGTSTPTCAPPSNGVPNPEALPECVSSPSASGAAIGTIPAGKGFTLGPGGGAGPDSATRFATSLRAVQTGTVVGASQVGGQAPELGSLFTLTAAVTSDTGPLLVQVEFVTDRGVVQLVVAPVTDVVWGNPTTFTENGVATAYLSVFGTGTAILQGSVLDGGGSRRACVQVMVPYAAPPTPSAALSPTPGGPVQRPSR